MTFSDFLRSAGIANLLNKFQFSLTQTPRIIGLIGDSRFASSYTKYSPSATVFAGNKITVTATAIGTNETVGTSFILGRSTGLDMVEATIESITSANVVVAVVNYPQGPLPTGDIKSAGSVILMQTSRPNIATSYPSWLLALTNQGVKDVINFAYHGARLQGMITHQIRRAKQRGCTEVWIHGGANDYLSNVDGKTSAYAIEKTEELWAAAKGMKIVHFTETPLGSTYYSAANATKVTDINTWTTANAGTYSVDRIDIYTPIYDSATGQALTGYLQDGLHPAMLGARVTMVAQAALSTWTRYLNLFKANQVDVATAHQVIVNPYMTGSLGASQVPTGYTSSVSGSVTVASYSLNAKTVETNEFVANITSTGAGSHYLKGAATTVVPGTNFRIRGKVRIASGVNVNYIECTLRNASGDGLLFNVWTPANYSSTGGDCDGSYTITYDCDFVIPAGVTSVYIRPRVFMGSVAGSATIGYSDEEMRGMPRATEVTYSTATSFTPADPAGTTSATQVMMGFGADATPVLVTPLKSSRLRVSISGQLASSGLNDGATVQLRYGTGTAPANAAAASGTQFGASQTMTALVAAQRSGFSISGVISGLIPGTVYWVDASLLAVTAGTSTITGVSIDAFEV